MLFSSMLINGEVLYTYVQYVSGVYHLVSTFLSPVRLKLHVAWVIGATHRLVKKKSIMMVITCDQNNAHNTNIHAWCVSFFLYLSVCLPAVFHSCVYIILFLHFTLFSTEQSYTFLAHEICFNRVQKSMFY